MIYAQFWHKGTDGLLRPACGSDSVLPIDGRFSAFRQHETACARLREPFFKRKYDAYTLHRGESYSRNTCTTIRPMGTDGNPIHIDRINRDFARNGRVFA